MCSMFTGPVSTIETVLRGAAGLSNDMNVLFVTRVTRHQHLYRGVGWAQ